MNNRSGTLLERKCLQTPFVHISLRQVRTAAWPTDHRRVAYLPQP
jgi:hypothetical protein